MIVRAPRPCEVHGPASIRFLRIQDVHVANRRRRRWRLGCGTLKKSRGVDWLGSRPGVFVERNAESAVEDTVACNLQFDKDGLFGIQHRGFAQELGAKSNDVKPLVRGRDVLQNLPVTQSILQATGTGRVVEVDTH